MKSVITSIAFACIIQLIHAKLTKKYDYTTFLDKTNTNVKFSWKYDLNDDKLFIGLEVNATGWVGCGFAHKISEMKGYDIVMGRVSEGKPIFSDRHTIGYQEPWADLQQDYNMTYYEEVNGTTTFEYNRKRLTNDSNDIDIKLGPMWVVYAYHSRNDYPYPYQSQHDHQGYKQLVILPLDTQLPGSSTSPTSSPGTTDEVLELLATLPSDTTSLTKNSSLADTGEALGSMAMPCSLPTGISLGLLAIVQWHLFII